MTKKLGSESMDEITPAQRHYIGKLSHKLDYLGITPLGSKIRNRINSFPVTKDEATCLIEGCLLAMSEKRANTTFQKLTE